MTKPDPTRITSKLQRVVAPQKELLINRISGDSGVRAAPVPDDIALSLVNAPEGTLLLQPGPWRVAGSDPGAALLLGHSVEALTGKMLAELIYLDREVLHAALNDAPQGVRLRLGTVPFKDGQGEALELQASAGWVRLQGQDYLALQIRDDSVRQRILETLQDSESKYRLLFEASPEAMWVFDRETLQFLAVNQTALARYGWSEAEFLALTLRDLRFPEDLPELEKNLQRIEQDGGTPQQFRHRRKDGSGLWANVTAHSLNFMGRAASIITARDVTLLVAAQANLQEREQLYQTVFEAAADAFLILDENRRVTHLNHSFTQLFGFTLEEIRGSDADEVLVPVAQLEHARENTARSYAGEVVDLTTVRLRKDATPIDVEVRGSGITIEGRPHLLVRYIDITERRRHQQQIETLAFQDPLTELPNRFRLGMLLEQALRAARINQEHLAVLFMDLDRFKTVNDSLGHSAGDSLLSQSAARIGTALRQGDIYGRLGGDEFLVILPNVAGAEDAMAIARRVLNAMKAPFQVNDRELYATISIGISVFPDDGEDVEVLIKNADAAMYRAKEKGRDTADLYTPAFTAQNLANLALESQMHKALAAGELQLFYQPVVSTETGMIASFEALVRWHHPEQGLLLPGQFIALAEATGFTLSMGPWLATEAAKQIRDWRRRAGLPLSVSMNLSARQFQQPGLVAMMREAMDAAGLGPGAIILEITESSAMQNIDAAAATLRELKAAGCRIAIDDFGTGYSSLSYLKRLPVDIVKIDQSFIRDLTVDPDDAAITTAVIAMARSLNLQVVAEGVETAAQLDFLRAQRCHMVQGFYLSRPVPPEAAEALLYRNGGKLISS